MAHGNSVQFPPAPGRGLPVGTRPTPPPPAARPPARREAGATELMAPPPPAAPKATDWTGLLARFRMLAMYYQQSHWSSHGDDYYGDHILLDRLYNEVSDEVDGIAEKGIGVTGSVAHVSLLTHLGAVTALAMSMPQAPNEDDVFFQGALDFELELAAWLGTQYASEPNIGVQNFLQGFVDAGSNRIYLLRRRLTPDTMD